MFPINASSHEFAKSLGAQLRDSVPEGVAIEVDGADVVIRFADQESRNGTASILDDDDGRSLYEKVDSATRAILSHVQDAASVATGRPWPGSGADMPLADVEVRNGHLHAWFGAIDAPVLRLNDIDLRDLDG